MITVSNAIQGINFDLDIEGVQKMIEALQKTHENQPFEIENISFSDNNGNITLRSLFLSISDENTIKIKDKEIHLSLEFEDVEYSIELFTKSKTKGDFDSPEWLQAMNLSNKRNYYIYVFFNH